MFPSPSFFFQLVRFLRNFLTLNRTPSLYRIYSSQLSQLKKERLFLSKGKLSDSSQAFLFEQGERVRREYQ